MSAGALRDIRARPGDLRLPLDLLRVQGRPIRRRTAVQNDQLHGGVCAIGPRRATDLLHDPRQRGVRGGESTLFREDARPLIGKRGGREADEEDVKHRAVTKPAGAGWVGRQTVREEGRRREGGWVGTSR